MGINDLNVHISPTSNPNQRPKKFICSITWSHSWMPPTLERSMVLCHFLKKVSIRLYVLIFSPSVLSVFMKLFVPRLFIMSKVDNYTLRGSILQSFLLNLSPKRCFIIMKKERKCTSMCLNGLTCFDDNKGIM